MTDAEKMPPTIHATAVQIANRGILLRGAPGSGKSSLALRLLDECILAGTPGYLIADDRVVLDSDTGRLVARAPETLRGLMEIRGLGIVTVDSLAAAVIDLAVDLVPADLFERHPESQAMEIHLGGTTLPRLQIVERNPDATVIIRAFFRSRPSRFLAEPAMA